MKKPVAIIVGTRPDAIKLMPVYLALKSRNIVTTLCATNQHDTLLTQVLDLFDVTPDIQMHVMQKNQTLDYLTASVLTHTTTFIKQHTPSLVIVQGDTTSSFASALAAYYNNIPIVHIEAGLRTGNAQAPFPEEINRTLLAKIAALHFSPTPLNVLNLLNEGIASSKIFCVGNTVIDALTFITHGIDTLRIPIPATLENMVNDCHLKKKRLVLFTMHRRESFGNGIRQTLQAIHSCAQKYPELFILFPAHPNPHVQQALAESGLLSLSNVLCCKPLAYHELIYILRKCSLVITDSGGIQEEAICLGKYVIILRHLTERIEVVWEKNGILVGYSKQAIESAIDEWMTSTHTYKELFLYGDGKTAQRIIDFLLDFFPFLLSEKVYQKQPVTDQMIRNYQIPKGGS